MLIWVRVIHSWKTHTDAYTQCSGTHWITAFTVTRSETKRNLGRTLHRCVRPCSLDISWGNIFGRKWTTYAKQQCSYPGGSSWPQHLTKALFWGTFLWICTMLNGSRLSVKGVSSIIKKILRASKLSQHNQNFSKCQNDTSVTSGIGGKLLFSPFFRLKWYSLYSLIRPSFNAKVWARHKSTWRLPCSLWSAG